MALEIQHSSDVILQRVNRFFGWSAVGRLALRQAPLSRRDPPRSSRAPDPQAVAKVAGSAPRSSEIEPAARFGRSGPPLPQLSFQASELSSLKCFGVNAPIQELTLIITRRAFTAALSLTGLGLLAGFSPLRLIAEAMAQSAAEVAKPVSLPDMALGPANAPVTITEFASMTCPHCANFTETVFPKIKSEYIDTGKIRFIFREFPLDIKAAAGSMLARCIAKDDAGKYFAVIDMLFKQQNDWVLKNTTETLTRIGKQAGLSQQQVEDCLKDQALLDKIAADQKFAADVLKVNSTPTFFINGEMIKGEIKFEDFDKKIKSLLKS
jgi:protein-disulfide isomerase